jgi:PAS domain S-box-containing protein
MGKTSREVFFPRPTQIAIDKFCEAGACGRASHFDFYSIVFRKHLDMYVLPCGKDKFGALFMDITARKEAERRLRESNDLLRTVVEAAPTAIIGLDLDGNVQTVWNRAAEKMLGWTAQEAMGHPLPSVPAAGQEEFEGFREEIRRGLALDGVEVRRQRKDGTPVDYSIYASPLHDAEGHIAGNIAVLVDITERKRMEDALRELNATLENKVVQRTAELEKRTRQLQHLALQLSQAEDRERKRIGAILHEDFQQQIAGAKLHLSLLNKRAKDDPPQQEIIARVDEILKDAIEQSRSLAHELSPAALSQNDLAEVLRWLAARMEAEQGLSVQVDAQDEVILQSDALTVFLFRAVQEMLLNVVKHTKARDATIRMSCHGRYVCISVCDRGRGFNPEEIGETTGFGLMNIRERCEMLGGRLKIKSHKDIGTTLYLTVPNEDTSATDANLHAVCVQGK